MHQTLHAFYNNEKSFYTSTSSTYKHRIFFPPARKFFWVHCVHKLPIFWHRARGLSCNQQSSAVIFPLFFFFNHTRSFVKGLLGFSLLHQTCKALSKTIFRDSGLRSLAIFDNLFYNRFLGGKRKRTQQPQCSWKRISLSSSRNTVWKYEPAIYLFSVDKMSHARFQMMLIYVLTAEVIFQSSFKE